MGVAENGVLAWDVVTVTGSFYDDDGFLDVSHDAYGEQNAGTDPNELHLPHGIIARPHDPDSDGIGNRVRACTMLLGLEGGHGHAFLCSDPRVLERLPQVSKGSGSAYGGPLGKVPSYAYFDGDDGTYKLVVGYAHGPDGAPLKRHTITVDPIGNTIAITHGDGASMTLAADGFTATATKVTLGQPTAQPVALASPVVAALQALAAGLQAVGAAAAAAPGAQGAGPAAVAAAQAAATPISQIASANTLAS